MKAGQAPTKVELIASVRLEPGQDQSGKLSHRDNPKRIRDQQKGAIRPLLKRAEPSGFHLEHCWRCQLEE
jgi:hypothetical protein